MCSVVVLGFVLASCTLTVFSQSTADVKSLFTQLFTTQGYNKKIRPADDQSLATDIQIDFHLSGIIEFDEQEESITTSGYLQLSWVDQDLDWTASSYSEIAYIFVPQDDVWKPDISLRNTFKALSGLGSSFLNVFVDSSGTILWTPFQVLTSTCGVDITYFPFDVQTCEMKFIAWSYRKTEVNLVLGSKGIILDDYQENSAWSLVETSAEGLVESEESAVVFIMKLKRKPLFYLLNIVIPVLMLSILSVFTFVLPTDSGERASYGITVFLSLAVFLTIVSSTLPKNSDTTSLLGVYLMLMTSFSTVIVIITIIQLRLASRDEKKEPIGVVFMALHRASCFLQCDCRKKDKVFPDTASLNKVEPVSKDVVDRGDEGDEDDLTWKSLMASLDYLFFGFFFLVTVICTVTIFSLAAAGSS